MIDELFEKYVDKFNEPVPVYIIDCLDEGKICEILKNCINSGKPLEPDFNKNCIY